MPALRARPRRPFRVLRSRTAAISDPDRAVLKRADAFLRALFQGKRGRPPAVRFPYAPPFMTRVWRAMAAVPFGRTITYAALARRAGRAAAARAAGQACARNPLPLFVPCHRILSAGGGLGGYSSGLAWKMLLLDREGWRR
jgi:methylated-DNA-[protein]-cysteine S-methyltransferase